MGDDYLYCEHREYIKQHGHSLKIPIADGRTVLLCRQCVTGLKLDVALEKAVRLIVQDEMVKLWRQYA